MNYEAFKGRNKPARRSFEMTLFINSLRISYTIEILVVSHSPQSTTNTTPFLEEIILQHMAWSSGSYDFPEVCFFNGDKMYNTQNLVF